MVREDEPPTPLKRLAGATEVVDGLPAQTMTALLKDQEYKGRRRKSYEPEHR